jgi:orotidine-5'-phosphate decarboxylase
MNYQKLLEQIHKKKSFLCVGLDSDINKIPQFLRENINPILDFNKAIIDATAPYVVAYKLNTAFYEVLGYEGWLQLQSTINYIKFNHPDILVIADAKRGDIGNTSYQYAKAFFEIMDADAVTVAPYMGKDSVEPFLKYKDKWIIILNLTSNESASDLQTLHIEENGDLVYEHMLKKALEWGATCNKSMFVVGATKAESLMFVRKIVPDHFLLIPGIGAQSGSLEEVAKYGFNEYCGLIVNNSRGIIFASNEKDFPKVAREKALEMQQKMEEILRKNFII